MVEIWKRVLLHILLPLPLPQDGVFIQRQFHYIIVFPLLQTVSKL